MANIMITDICNLNCSYCFANEFVNKNGVNHIAVDSFIRILDFIDTAKEKEHVGLIGGEPTLHPEFARLLSIINERTDIDDVVVFTNGILIDRYFDELTNPKMFLLINCNSPDIIGRHHYDIIKRNIRTAVERYGMKERITPGLNIFAERMDYQYIIDLIDEFQFDHLRLSIVVPNQKQCEKPLEYFSKMKRITLEIMEAALKHGAMPYFDCNKIPVCIMTRDDRKRLLELCGDKPISNILSEYSNCTPVLDILQNEVCVRCFGLSDHLKADINGFETIDDLRGFFETRIDAYAHNTYYHEQCRNCYERVCRKCSGGCLAYKTDKIDQLAFICEQGAVNDQGSI